MNELNFRQIHLDFHTSGEIPGIGADWDAGHFQEMLQLGYVNSINIFAKCHHGWSYHPTEVPLSRMHPHLSFDLLGEMIAAAHEIGVKTPVYVSAGLDEKLTTTHSHWLKRGEDGTAGWASGFKAGYHAFCMRSPYLDYLIAQAEEVTRNYDLDGIWLDIVGVGDCCCQYCISALRERGEDPRDKKARARLNRETYLNYARRMNTALHAIKPELLIFHNGGHITRGDRELADLDTHLELESLPTGGWGYDHFPLSARYVQGLGKQVIGMTGKFHTTWGEFGGFKHPNALRYEAALTLANGAKCCIGDQMHPAAKLDKATYSLIGSAYAEVAEKEAWCSDVESIADVAVLSMQAMNSYYGGELAGRDGDSDAGVIRVLLEGKILFDVVDMESDFTKYQLLILPDAVKPDARLVDKVNEYLQQGGKIFVTGNSMFDDASEQFVIDLGCKYRAAGEFSPVYIAPRFQLQNWQNAAFVVYSTAKEIEVTHGTVLADRQNPYFNRDYLHFCSHQHAPTTGENMGAMMVATEQSIYLAFPAFASYAEKGQNVLRDIILHGLRRLLAAPALTTSLPAQGIQTVMWQRANERAIIHLLYASPVRRGKDIEVIEDLLPIRNTEICYRCATTPKHVYLAPAGTDLPYTYQDGILKAVVPEFSCHQMIVVE